VRQLWPKFRKILPVTVSYPQYKEKEGKEEYLYSAFIERLVKRRSDMDHTVLPGNYTMPALKGSVNYEPPCRTYL